jgi:nucleoside-diphosphate-sugar epimerase
MRIFVAGATGTLGQPVVRALLARGHHVVGLTRAERRRHIVEQLGAEAVVGDALDERVLRAAVTAARPDQVLHLLTAIPPAGALRARDLAATNVLRIRGTSNVIGAARVAGARRIVAESFIGVYGVTRCDREMSEDAPFAAAGGGAFRGAIQGLRSLEAQLAAARVTGQIETVSLRIGLLYGSAVPSSRAMMKQARAGWLFAPRSADGLVPSVHVDDAAAAIVAAVEAERPGPVYNIVDDQPMSLETLLDLTSRAAGADRPRRLPLWFLKVVAPIIAEVATVRLPLSNARAKRELGWVLRYPTVEVGLEELGQRSGEAPRPGSRGLAA